MFVDLDYKFVYITVGDVIVLGKYANYRGGV